MQNVNNTEMLNHVSLCYGYGGIDLGIERVFGKSLRTIFISEIETYAIENVIAKMEEGRISPCPIWTNLRTIPWKLLSGRVDILSGGFPCQPFSAAGKRAGDEDERHLFPFILQGIQECQSRIVFLENVEGILSAKLSGDGWRDPAGTPVLLHVLRELERVGYRCTAGMFSAEEVGAPHRRNRIFILGVANGGGGERLQRGIGSWETGTEGAPHGHTAERCSDVANGNGSGSWKDFLLSQLRADRFEQPSEDSRLLGSEGEGREVTRWPARPGQPQFDWEPPRTI